MPARNATKPNYHRFRKLRLLVLQRDEFTCHWCGTEVTPETADVDHLTPRALGGEDNMENLVTSCRACNRSRGARLGNARRRGGGFFEGPQTTPRRKVVSLPECETFGPSRDW